LVTLASTTAGQSAFDGKVLAEMTATYASGDDADAASYDRLLSLAVQMQATIVGPGIPKGPGMQAVLERLVSAWPLPLVIDADALSMLGTSLSGLVRGAPAPRIVTPHPGEMGRLLGISTGEVEADRLGHARAYSQAAQSVVILKGARTIVALPTGEAFVNPHANPSLGTAGSGDVLTGVVGAFLTQGLSPADAACAAVFVHGLSAELATTDLRTHHLIASDLPDAVGRACEQLGSV
jgi:NAD(P)H-hydrate epimerase